MPSSVEANPQPLQFAPYNEEISSQIIHSPSPRMSASGSKDVHSQELFLDANIRAKSLLVSLPGELFRVVMVPFALGGVIADLVTLGKMPFMHRWAIHQLGVVTDLPVALADDILCGCSYASTIYRGSYNDRYNFSYHFTKPLLFSMTNHIFQGMQRKRGLDYADSSPLMKWSWEYARATEDLFKLPLFLTVDLVGRAFSLIGSVYTIVSLGTKAQMQLYLFTATLRNVEVVYTRVMRFISLSMPIPFHPWSTASPDDQVRLLSTIDPEKFCLNKYGIMKGETYNEDLIQTLYGVISQEESDEEIEGPNSPKKEIKEPIIPLIDACKDARVAYPTISYLIGVYRKYLTEDQIRLILQSNLEGKADDLVFIRLMRYALKVGDEVLMKQLVGTYKANLIIDGGNNKREAAISAFVKCFYMDGFSPEYGESYKLTKKPLSFKNPDIFRSFFRDLYIFLGRDITFMDVANEHGEDFSFLIRALLEMDDKQLIEEVLATFFNGVELFSKNPDGFYKEVDFILFHLLLPLIDRENPPQRAINRLFLYDDAKFIAEVNQSQNMGKEENSRFFFIGNFLLDRVRDLSKRIDEYEVGHIESSKSSYGGSDKSDNSSSSIDEELNTSGSNVSGSQREEKLSNPILEEMEHLKENRKEDALHQLSHPKMWDFFETFLWYVKNYMQVPAPSITGSNKDESKGRWTLNDLHSRKVELH